jgi:hypothetical protein
MTMKQTRRGWRIWNGEKLKAQFQIEPRDLWVGMFWRRTGLALHLYLCIVPIISLHVIITTQRWIEEWETKQKAELNAADFECQYRTPEG